MGVKQFNRHVFLEGLKKLDPMRLQMSLGLTRHCDKSLVKLYGVVSGLRLIEILELPSSRVLRRVSIYCLEEDFLGIPEVFKATTVMSCFYIVRTVNRYSEAIKSSC